MSTHHQENGSPNPFIWLASYPRSGNTLLRTVLWHCFGLRSASIYPNDLGGNKALENYVGHIGHTRDGRIFFSADTLPLIKTHELPPDDKPAIYIVRDGRAACISLWEFYNRSLPLEAVITGHHRFGTWSDHLNTWRPLSRHDTLLLTYEELTTSFTSAIDKLERYLNRERLSNRIPDRSQIAAADGRWVRRKSHWELEMTNEMLELFMSVNGNAMENMGYIP